MIQAQSQASLCDVCSDKSSNMTGFSPRRLRFTPDQMVQIHSFIHEYMHSFFIIKPSRFTNFTNLFWHETLHVSDSSSVHHQEFIHRTLSNGICHTGL